MFNLSAACNLRLPPLKALANETLRERRKQVKGKTTAQPHGVKSGRFHKYLMHTRRVHHQTNILRCSCSLRNVFLKHTPYTARLTQIKPQMCLVSSDQIFAIIIILVVKFTFTFAFISHLKPSKCLKIKNKIFKHF